MKGFLPYHNAPGLDGRYARTFLDHIPLPDPYLEAQDLYLWDLIEDYPPSLPRRIFQSGHRPMFLGDDEEYDSDEDMEITRVHVVASMCLAIFLLVINSAARYLVPESRRQGL